MVSVQRRGRPQRPGIARMGAQRGFAGQRSAASRITGLARQGIQVHSNLSQIREALEARSRTYERTMSREELIAYQREMQEKQISQQHEAENLAARVLTATERQEVQKLKKDIAGIIQLELNGNLKGIGSLLSGELAELFFQAGLLEHIAAMHPTELKKFLVKSGKLRQLIMSMKKFGRYPKISKEEKREIMEELQEALQGE